MKIKDIFIASETNQYQPWITTNQALAFFCAFIWILRFTLPSIMTVQASSVSSRELMEKINNERTQRYLTALIFNNKLESAATAKSNDMIRRSYFAHVNPDGQYVWPMIESAGYYPYITLGENLAMDFLSSDAVVSAWMNSPTHRANLLNEKFEDQGLASIFGNYEPGHDSYLITSLFGTLVKKSEPVTPPPPPAEIPQTKGTTKPSVATETPKQTPPASTPPAETTEPPIVIGPDMSIMKKSLGDSTLVEIQTKITGNPRQLFASIGDKTTEMLPAAKSEEYLAVISMPSSTEFEKLVLNIKAYDKNHKEYAFNYNLKNIQEVTSAPQNETSASGVLNTNIPIKDKTFLTVVKYVTSGIALFYVLFLLIDSYIIFKAKIKRQTINSSSHTFLFLLILIGNLYITWL
jgi:uncharacterized protein YkwD